VAFGTPGLEQVPEVVHEAGDLQLEVAGGEGLEHGGTPQSVGEQVGVVGTVRIARDPAGVEQLEQATDAGDPAGGRGGRRSGHPPIVAGGARVVEG
jgi:hypothetical protein